MSGCIGERYRKSTRAGEFEEQRTALHLLRYISPPTVEILMRHCALLLLLLCLADASRAGATLERVMRTKVLNDILATSYPPFGFIDEHNELAGFDVDVARAVATRLNLALRLHTPAWEMVVSGRWQGRWDLCICSMTPTTERAAVLSFPVRYYSSPAVLTVHRADTRIHSAADLSGRRVGVGVGSSYERYIEKSLVIPGTPPIVFPFHDVMVIPGDESVNFQNLALGPGLRLDAIVSDFATAHAFIESTKALKIVGPVLYAEPNMIATERGDPEWDRTLAQTIEALRADGTLKRIAARWFAQDITRDGP
jgi:polar amino acid transport system substrate-binding protein